MDGQPVEHFLDIVPLKATDAKTIYSALVEFMKDKNIQISKLVGMGFDGAATFSGKQWCAESPEENFTSCTFRTLPLPFATASMRSSS